MLSSRKSRYVVTEKQQAESLSIGHQIENLTLSTKGRKRQIYLKKPSDPIKFSLEDLDTYQVHSGASGQQMKTLSSFIRTHAGRKSIPADYSTHIAERARILEDLYQYGEFDFEIEKSAVHQKRPVVWCNAEEILEEVIQRRTLIGNYVIKVMADGGQKFA